MQPIASVVLIATAHHLIRYPGPLQQHCSQHPRQRIIHCYQQKQQIVPILKEELKQLGALKKDTSLSGLKKVERLREIGVSFDEKLKPLLNADQHQKFQTLRENFRRRLVEEMAEIVMRAARAAPGPARVYNTTGEVITTRRTIEILEALFPGVRFDAEPGTAGLVWRYDSGRIERELGFRSRVGVEEGFARTVETMRRWMKAGTW